MQFTECVTLINKNSSCSETKNQYQTKHSSKYLCMYMHVHGYMYIQYIFICMYMYAYVFVFVCCFFPLSPHFLCFFLCMLIILFHKGNFILFFFLYFIFTIYVICKFYNHVFLVYNSNVI